MTSCQRRWYQTISLRNDNLWNIPCKNVTFLLLVFSSSEYLTFKITNLSEKDSLVFTKDLMRKINLIFGFLTKLKICERILGSYRIHSSGRYGFMEYRCFYCLWNIVRKIQEYACLVINQELIDLSNSKDIFSCKSLIQNCISNIHSRIYKHELNDFMIKLCLACVDFSIGKYFNLSNISDDFNFMSHNLN